MSTQATVVVEMVGLVITVPLIFRIVEVGRVIGSALVLTLSRRCR